MRTPSTKVSLILFVTVLVVIGTILLNEREDKEIRRDKLQFNVGVSVENKLDSDSDGDGLLDWEESLWGTNPLVADTDGDGTQDEEEINSNRDPLVAGPNDDNYSVEEKIAKEFENTPLADNSLTNKVGRSFAEAYFTLRSNNLLNDENKKILVEDVLEQTLINTDLNKERYSENQFLTFSVDNTDYLESYANDLFNIILSDSGELENAVYVGDYTKVSDILYNTSQKLLLLNVPQPILTQHTELTNSYLTLSEALFGSEQSESDPILASLSFYTFTSTDEKITTLIEDIGIFLRQNGIIYKDGEIIIEKND